MKLSFMIFTLAISSVAAKYKTIQLAKSGLAADSDLGMKVLSKARLLEENYEDDNNEERENEEREDKENQSQGIDTTWVSGYSFKFLGCHHIKQWNADADEKDDVKIKSKRLVRFRLCPTSACKKKFGGGCSDGYGDYIVDLDTFIDAYYENSRQRSERKCQYYLKKNCNCYDNDDGNDDDYNKEICEYKCFAAANMESSCVERNPYEDDNEEDQFDAAQFMKCQQFQPKQNQEKRGRRVEEEEGNADGEEDHNADDQDHDADDERNQEDAWYVGPYCSDQGGAVYLGLFTDDKCTEFADSDNGQSTFQSLAGHDLPYSAVSIVGNECVSCLDLQGQGDDDDSGEDDEALGVCQEIYNYAGKCEKHLSRDVVAEPNNNACNYISGVKVVLHDGIITRPKPKTNSTATFFIIMFALLCVTLSFYIHYLRTKLRVRDNALL